MVRVNKIFLCFINYFSLIFKLFKLAFLSFFIISCNNDEETHKVTSQSLNSPTVVKTTRKDASDTHFENSFERKEQNFSLEQLDNTKGLSNSSVNTIFQDSENILWIGTWDGLNKYNGFSFDVYRPEVNDNHSLNNQVVLKIEEDADGRIWVVTMGGINSFDKITSKFTNYTFPVSNEFTLSETEFNLAVDKEKNIYCFVKGWGIGVFNQGEFKKISTGNLRISGVQKMEFDNRDRLLLLTDLNELLYLDVSKDNHAAPEKLIGDIQGFGFFESGNICINNFDKSIAVLSLDTRQSKRVDVGNVQKVIGQSEKGVILAGKEGYFTIAENGDIIDHSWMKFFDNKVISYVLMGVEGVLWVGTDGDGLLKMYPQNNSFNLLSKSEIPDLEGGIVRAFAKSSDGYLLVGTKGKGLFKIEEEFIISSGAQGGFINYHDKNSDINNSVFALFESEQNFILIGTDGEGLALYDLQQKKIIGWSELKNSQEIDYFKSVYAIHQDEDGTIWLGTNGFGLVRFKLNRIGKQITVTDFKIYKAGINNTLSSNIIYDIKPKNEGELWLATRLGGLNLFDKSTESFTVFKNQPDNPYSLSSNDVLSLHVDKNKSLWVGTSYGLNLLKETNQNETHFEQFTTENGLPNNNIHGIETDAYGNGWISTNLGLAHFKVSKKKFINFTQKDGLQNNEFSDGACYKDPDSGIIFMGGIKGFNYFEPSTVVETDRIPPLIIRKISSQDHENPLIQDLVVSHETKNFPYIELNHDENFFDIELNALTYVNGEKCQYAYQLENFNKSWQYIDSRKLISFTNVPEGNYALWLNWTNSDGVWSEPIRAIEFRVNPIFWRSKTALILYFTFVIMLIWLSLSYYHNQQKLKQAILFRKKEEEIHLNKLTFFTNIAHELQTPLTLIVAPAQKLSKAIDLNEKNARYVKMIQLNASRLFFLTQQLLDFRRAENDHLDVYLQQFDLVSLIEQIVELFDEWALQKNISYEADIPKSLPGWFDKDKIEKITFNLLSNAFKYTPINGTIKVKVGMSNSRQNGLVISVSNTGKGIPKDKLKSIFDRFILFGADDNSDSTMFRTGIGLSYIKRIVSVMKGEIKVESVQDKETVFKVELPCDSLENVEMNGPLEKEQVVVSQHLQNILGTSYDEDKIKEDSKVLTVKSVEENRKSILVVEDDLEIQNLLFELLRVKYVVYTASNGKQALDLMALKSLDLVISDVMMPEMDGLELCSILKKGMNTCHIPIILLTAKNSVIHRIEGLERGANSYIPKPFYPDHLLVRIEKLLEERDRIKNYFTSDLVNDNLTDLPLEPEDKQFMKKVIDIIKVNIDNEELQSSFIEETLGMSNSKFYRKVKAAFGFAPNDLIRIVRLRYAAELLQKSELTVSEICYKSGFNNRSHFYRQFNKMFNETPKNYQEKYKKKK